MNATYPSTGTKTYDNDILKCVTDSTGTTFSISDWALASRYTDSASFDAFLNNEFSTLSNQVDQKAEIWQGSSDPSTAWTTEALKASHVDDMWYDASVGKYKIYSATTSGNTTTYGWTLTDITPPSSVLSTIDGKANVYVGATLPAGITPKTGDLWFKGTNEAIYTYNGSSWVVYNKYTDDSSLTAFLDGYSGTLTQVQSQIDQKAEIWKSSSDPSSAWTTTALKNNHLGDIWFDTTNQVCKTYVLDGSTYKWEVMTTQPPTSVLNTIDGKANIFVGSTAPTVPYKVGDLWVNATYTSGSTSYTNEILKCKTARSTGTFTLSDWEKASKYTDDTTAIESAKTASSYIYYDSTNGLVLHGLNDTITSSNFATKMSTIGANARLTSSGLGIYVNNKLLTQYGESTYFYSWNGNTQSVAATLSSTGLNIAKGTITLGSNFSVAADGTLTAAAGTIANINITTTTNTNTHYFKDSLYSQATEIIGNETVRIYEFGINASDDADDTSTPVFYVRQNNPLSSWTSSNGQWNFYVSKSGDLYARNASFGDDSFIITSTANTSTHCYAHSLYKHSFEINETTGNTSGAYECGISGDDSYYFLYVNKKNNVSGTWASSNISNLFYVNYSGDLVCQNFASNYISSNSSGTYLGNISAQSGGHTNTTKVLCLSDTATSGKYKVGYVTIEPGETAVEEEEMSSIRFKNVDRNLTSDDIEAFYSVNPVFASYKDEYLNGRDYWKDVKMPMMIAEDIEKALPKSVKYDSDDNVKDYSNHVVLSVHQKMLIDQREKITKLEEEVAQLKKLLAKLG